MPWHCPLLPGCSACPQQCYAHATTAWEALFDSGFWYWLNPSFLCDKNHLGSDPCEVGQVLPGSFHVVAQQLSPLRSRASTCQRSVSEQLRDSRVTVSIPFSQSQQPGDSGNSIQFLQYRPGTNNTSITFTQHYHSNNFIQYLGINTSITFIQHHHHNSIQYLGINTSITFTQHHHHNSIQYLGINTSIFSIQHHHSSIFSRDTGIDTFDTLIQCHHGTNSIPHDSPTPTVSPNSTSTVTTSSRATAAPGSTAGSSELSPAVVALISLAVCLLVAGVAVLLVRLSRRGTPRFQHLDEVPMSKVMEGSPITPPTPS
ncbi:hypothetical protein DV515_00018676 [Chloebia gouldiae]|uniref:Uncharacterized protein n=1 Tax=Chloebia gouldiae TaxID=44316 RepID=A0A3L8Q6U8_CHLGU|nr:hypothetical protein DV515_00018676 [Chloebia gouldiae]